MKFFNTAGPINPDDHYFIDHRLDEKLVRLLIEQKHYFILHAPRQSGKTTAMLALMRQLNDEGRYKSLYINVEPAQIARSDVLFGMRCILKELEEWGKLQLAAEDSLFSHIKKELEDLSTGSFKAVLQAWSRSSQKPIILFIDEVDSLIGDTLVALLRQLRAGYINRPHAFPQSLCLIGVRDVRDYRIWSEEEKSLVAGGSAFNIKAESLTLPNFTQEQIRQLCEQHTQATGQAFSDGALAALFLLTQGQPWLVNALAYEVCFRTLVDRSQGVDQQAIVQAKEQLIKRRDTHLDALLEKLSEPRVSYIMDAIISGTGQTEDFKSDDIAYCRDLGLLKHNELSIANPIYQEIIPRELVHTKQESIAIEPLWYVNNDGTLNMHKLFNSFTQ